MPEETEVSTTFAYQAQTVDGQPINGTIDAADAEQAGRLLNNLHLRVLQVEPVRRPVRAKPLRGDDFVAFNQQLTQLTAAGLPVEQGLKLIAQDMRSGRLAETIRQVAAELERGTPLGEAFDKFEKQFPPLYGKLVAAGVRTNNLSAMLLNLGRHLDLVTRLRGMLWRSLSYPLMVIVTLALVILFLGMFVIPQFKNLYSGFGIQLPTVTVMLLASSRWLPVVALVIFAAVLAAPLLWQVLRTAGADRAVIDNLILPMPIIGRVLERNLVARWCDSVRLGVQAGMDLPASIDLAGEAVGSPALVRDGNKIVALLQSGQRVDTAQNMRILPTTVATVLALGSQQHDLPVMLGTLSEMYQQQAETRLGLIPGLLTPILVVVIGLIMGFVITALFMPFIVLIQNLTGGGH